MAIGRDSFNAEDKDQFIDAYQEDFIFKTGYSPYLLNPILDIDHEANVKKIKYRTNVAKFLIKQLLHLIQALEKIEAGKTEEQNLLICIGSGFLIHQAIPKYLQEIKTENIRILLIDGFTYSSFSEEIEKFEINTITPVIRMPSDDPDNYTYALKDPLLKYQIDVFGCDLPEITAIPQATIFYSILKNAISKILDKKGRVFIANHTQAYSLEDIPDIGNLYNELKTHPDSCLLQLYTQAGCGHVRYYLEQLYDPKSSSMKPTISKTNAFYTCPSLSDLCIIEKFINPIIPKSTTDVLENSANKNNNPMITIQEEEFKKDHPTSEIIGSFFQRNSTKINLNESIKLFAEPVNDGEQEIIRSSTSVNPN